MCIQSWKLRRPFSIGTSALFVWEAQEFFSGARQEFSFIGGATEWLHNLTGETALSSP